MSAQPPACSMNLRRVHWTARCGLAPGSSVLAGGTGASPEIARTRPHHCLSASSIAHSVGDLCMAVQHVPVPGPPALSMMARWGAFHCAVSQPRSKQNPRLSLCKRHVPSQALRRDPVSRLHRSRADDLRSPLIRSPRACLVHFAGVVLYHSPGVNINSNTAVSRSASAARAVVSSGCAPRSGLFSATQMLVVTALCKSTADQDVACAAKPI